MNTLIGRMQEKNRKYFTLYMLGGKKRRLHIDGNHVWRDFSVNEGDLIKVTLHPIEQNAITHIERKRENK